MLYPWVNEDEHEYARRKVLDQISSGLDVERKK